MSTKSVEFRKGDVVLVSFPYTTDQGLLQTKRRPAVIVSNDADNVRLDDVLVVPLTSRISNASGNPHGVVVSMNSPDGQAAGLRVDSVIDCSLVATIPKAIVFSKVGQFSAAIRELIDERIRDDPHDL